MLHILSEPFAVWISGQKGVVVQHGFADVHFVEPLPALDGQRRDALRIRDVHGAEGPAVDFKRFAVLLGRVAAALVIGVGLDDRRGRGETAREKLLHPRARDDVRSLRLAGVQLDGDLPRQHGRHAVKNLQEAQFGQIAREEHDGALSGALLKRDVAVSVLSRDGSLFFHGFLLSLLPTCREAAVIPFCRTLR